MHCSSCRHCSAHNVGMEMLKGKQWVTASETLKKYPNAFSGCREIISLTMYPVTSDSVSRAMTGSHCSTSWEPIRFHSTFWGGCPGAEVCCVWKKWAEKERKGSQCAINCAPLDNTKMFDKLISTVSRGSFFQLKSFANQNCFYHRRIWKLWFIIIRIGFHSLILCVSLTIPGFNIASKLFSHLGQFLLLLNAS